MGQRVEQALGYLLQAARRFLHRGRHDVMVYIWSRKSCSFLCRVLASGILLGLQSKPWRECIRLAFPPREEPPTPSVGCESSGAPIHSCPRTRCNAAAFANLATEPSGRAKINRSCKATVRDHRRFFLARRLSALLRRRRSRQPDVLSGSPPGPSSLPSSSLDGSATEPMLSSSWDGSSAAPSSLHASSTVSSSCGLPAASCSSGGASRGIAASIGIGGLLAGGSAIDSLVAVTAAISVTWPSGVGMYRPGNRKASIARLANNACGVIPLPASGVTRPWRCLRQSSNAASSWDGARQYPSAVCKIMGATPSTPLSSAATWMARKSCFSVALALTGSLAKLIRSSEQSFSGALQQRVDDATR